MVLLKRDPNGHVPSPGSPVRLDMCMFRRGMRHCSSKGAVGRARVKGKSGRIKNRQCMMR
jgi:hypothetical protein